MSLSKGRFGAVYIFEIRKRRKKEKMNVVRLILMKNVLFSERIN